MSGWLAPVAAALDRAEAPIDVFIRDDDAGWADERLFALLDLCERHRAPIDLAVIPMATGPDLAAELRARRRAGGGRLGVHQHGYTHTNHEVNGRKCEFGQARSPESQRRDIAAGHDRLRELFGEDLDPIFTPPWNRCTAATVLALAHVGLPVLSRDRTAAPFAHPDVHELVVQVDWFAARSGTRLTRDELATEMAARVDEPVPLGVMLHHAVMDRRELDGVEELLSLLTAHPNVAMRSMATIAAGPSRLTKEKS